jgi:hypothetical protein
LNTTTPAIKIRKVLRKIRSNKPVFPPALL